ncbi:unnamed protein product [Dibothriocephalus latus]|uniref:Laminin G domain-containing protein n=1 Tax=Dibothriocephalus latus TaxID=60516 RepID=A0A3P6TYS8_DIBLA|nr:unnamed protein product [Dibothriocephalus latus]
MELFGCEYRPFTAYFDGKTWIELLLDRPGRETQTAVDHLKFRFRTSKVNGLILYGDDSQRDYLTVELYRARLQVSVNLGIFPWADEQTDNSVLAGSLLDDDQWHDVSIIRTEKNLNISVDGVSTWRNLSAIFVHMDMNRKLYIGGLPSFANKKSVTVTENFQGCLEEFNFNGVQFIRDTQRTQQGLIMTEQQWRTEDWLEALGYPPKDPILWWGPPTTTQDLNITGFAIGGTGQLVEILMPGVNFIRNTIPNLDSAAPNGTFADGLWHSVYFKMQADLVEVAADNRMYRTIQKFLQQVIPLLESFFFAVSF